MRWFLIKHPEGTFLFQGKGGLILFNQKAFLKQSAISSAAESNPGTGEVLSSLFY